MSLWQQCDLTAVSPVAKGGGTGTSVAETAATDGPAEGLTGWAAVTARLRSMRDVLGVTPTRLAAAELVRETLSWSPTRV